MSGVTGGAKWAGGWGISVASLRRDPDPVLCTPTSPVELFDAALTGLVEEMFPVMRLLNGVGLAAVQVGVPLRVFVFEADGVTGVMVNPVVLRRSLSYYPDEGCLSVPSRFFSPLRHQKVEVIWQELDGSSHTAVFEGLLAEIVEHEVDHLDGVLLYQRPQAPLEV